MMKVLLGVCDDKIPEGTKTGFDTNKIGGLPIWPVEGLETPVCEGCGRKLHLIAQVYCPLESSQYHRILYVFCCITTTCQNSGHSWKVLRSQILDRSYCSKPVPMLTKPAQPDDKWGDDADDWGDDDDDDDAAVLDDNQVPEMPPNMAAMDMDPKIGPKSGIVSNSPERENKSLDGFQQLTIDDIPSLDSHCDMVACNDSKDSCKIGSVSLDDEGGAGISDEHGASESGAGICEDNGTVQGCIAEDVPLDLAQNSILASFIPHKHNQKTEQNGMNNASLPDTGIINEHMLPDNHSNNEGLFANGTISKCVPPELDMTRIFPPYYMSVFEETQEPAYSLNHDYELLERYGHKELLNLKAMTEGASNSGCSSGGGEKYEKSEAKHGDKMFHKFQKKLSFCPEQVLRYCHKGEPVHIQDTHQVSAPCTCGAARVLEFQLMPALVNLLRFSPTEDPAVEFGTILVYTCEGSCWDKLATYRTEMALLESDPDQMFFRS